MTMSLTIRFSLIIFVVIIPKIFGDIQNETVQSKSGDDLVDSGFVITRNNSSNISLFDGNVTSNALKSSGENESFFRSIEETLPSTLEIKNKIEFNLPKNSTLTNFRPSQQLETHFEYNKVPVIPAYAEPKSVGSSVTVNGGSYEEKLTFLTKKQYEKNDPLPLENEGPRLVQGFEPGHSAFGSTNRYLDGSKVNRGYVSEGDSCMPCKLGPHLRDNGYNSEAPWISRIKFPISSNANERTNTFPSQVNSNSYHENNGHTNSFSSKARPNEYQIPNKPSEFLQQPNNFPITSNSNDFNRYNYGSDKDKIFPHGSSGFGTSGGGGGKYLPPSNPSGPSTEFNFNKPVEVPDRYPQISHKTFPYQKTFDTFYNLMERPPSEHEYKNHGEEHGMSYNPWKKILKLLATFVPIGLLISALTPTVITVTNVNDTSTDTAAQSIRYRSNDESKKELTNRIVSSLEFFEELNANGCEYRVFCELLVSASHMDNAEHHVNNLLDSFSKEKIDLKSQEKELMKVFEAVKKQDCNSIKCDFIKKPT